MITYFWKIRLAHSFYYEYIKHVFGNRETWNYFRHYILPDNWQEINNDYLGMYCAGGEL